MSCRWVGIDCGFSQMSIAIFDQSDRVLAVERTREPRGDGHNREIALARLRELLARLRKLRDEPVRLAGYCYEHAGVYEAFEEEGWTVAGGAVRDERLWAVLEIALQSRGVSVHWVDGEHAVGSPPDYCFLLEV